jgi:hypothetical protein
MVIGGLAQILYNVSTSTLVTWILAAIPLVLGVLVLLLPLNSLHRVFLDAKKAVLKELEKAYDRLSLSFTIQLTDERNSGTSGRDAAAVESLALKVNSLKGILDEIRDLSTWPVEAPVAFRIVATSLIPLAYFFIQEFLRGVWFQ